MKTATHIPEFDHVSDSGAVQKCYRLSEPLDGHGTVVVSAVVAMFSGPETCIFPADEQGNITDFLELDGSYRGAMNHAHALNNAGYEVA